MAMRKTITPDLSKGRVLEVAAQGGTRTCGVVDLHDIITTVACAHAKDNIQKYEEYMYLAVVSCSDATFFHNAGARRCDVFMDLWEDRGAHHDGQDWASWWVYDGGDDVAHRQSMDAVGKLNDQVKKMVVLMQPFNARMERWCRRIHRRRFIASLSAASTSPSFKTIKRPGAWGRKST